MTGPNRNLADWLGLNDRENYPELPSQSSTVTNSICSMSARRRSVSPLASSSRPDRSGYYRDRADRERRRDRDGEHYERDRRDRDEYRSSGSNRRGRDYDSKRGSRRSASPPSRSSRKPRDSRSKSPSSRRRRSRSRSRSKSRRAGGDEGGVEEKDVDKDADKGKPNLGHSGLLAAATKTVKTGEGKDVVLKYHEPPEARKPLLGWRLYVFKGNEQVGVWSQTFCFLRLSATRVDLLHIHRQSAYLIGRDKAVVDIPLDHPSCSKQHAVVQRACPTSVKPFTTLT